MKRVGQNLINDFDYFKEVIYMQCKGKVKNSQALK